MTSTKRSKPRIFELNIRLSDVEPPVWRRLRISSGVMLERVARIFAVAMGWAPGRPYAFLAGATRYEGRGPRGDWRDAGVEVRLRQLLPDAGAEMEFEYGNSHAWHFVVRLERLLPPDDSVRTPFCLNGAGISPPLDVGGPWAYEEWRLGPTGGLDAALDGAEYTDAVARASRVRFNPDVVNAEFEQMK